MKKASILCIALVALATGILSAGVAPLSAADPYKDRLSSFVGNFGFKAEDRPNFDVPKFNRLMGRSRVAAERAERNGNRGRLGVSAFWLARSVAYSERATAVAIAESMSGSGYSDDLAGYGAFIAQ